MNSPSPDTLEGSFRSLRAELAIRAGFPAAVLEEAERVAKDRTPVAGATRTDRTAIPFVTIDPPGSRDLDQAVQVEKAGDGYRVRYAIADVGFWVDRGGEIEKEAWLRAVTFYAPDHREPLYPPLLSAGAASLLPETTCPAILFTFELDGRAELRAWAVERALVRSRAQLTYTQLLEHVAEGPGESTAAWGETLDLLGEIGPKRALLEAERGGVSLPIREQQVQRQVAAALGYELVYERPSEAEKWNAQISLLTGHAAAVRMLEGGVGLIRTMPPIEERGVAKLRLIAEALGFNWAADMSYSDFMHSLDPAHPRIEVLVRQARRVIRGADYIFFDGALPEQPLHGALAFPYAHVTAPLRRLADRYVLDLLLTLAAGARPTAEELTTLGRLPQVMNDADARTAAMERQVIDVAEEWALKDRAGEEFEAVVIDVRADEVEVQLEDPPVRANVARPKGVEVELGERVRASVIPAKAGIQLSLGPRNALTGDPPVG